MQKDSPRGISFTDNGYIVISDFNEHCMLVIHPNSTTVHTGYPREWHGDRQFMCPTIDHMGNFVIADTRNYRVVIMQPDGHLLGSGIGQFDGPTDVAVLPDGKIAVLDFGNSRIQIF